MSGWRAAGGGRRADGGRTAALPGPGEPAVAGSGARGLLGPRDAAREKRVRLGTPATPFGLSMLIPQFLGCGGTPPPVTSVTAGHGAGVFAVPGQGLPQETTTPWGRQEVQGRAMVWVSPASLHPCSLAWLGGHWGLRMGCGPSLSPNSLSGCPERC